MTRCPLTPHPRPPACLSLNPNPLPQATPRGDHLESTVTPVAGLYRWGRQGISSLQPLGSRGMDTARDLFFLLLQADTPKAAMLPDNTAIRGSTFYTTEEFDANFKSRSRGWGVNLSKQVSVFSIIKELTPVSPQKASSARLASPMKNCFRIHVVAESCQPRAIPCCAADLPLCQ